MVEQTHLRESHLFTISTVHSGSCESPPLLHQSGSSSCLCYSLSCSLARNLRESRMRNVLISKLYFKDIPSEVSKTIKELYSSLLVLTLTLCHPVYRSYRK